MKIDIKSPTDITLGSLEAGRTFLLCNDYYIVTDEYTDAKREEVICVELYTGGIYRHSIRTKVTPVTLKVVKDGD